MRPHASLALAAAAVVVLAGCGPSTGATNDPVTTEPAATTSGSPAPLTGEITVLAAASLGEAFGQLADDFHAANPGATVTLGLGPSSALAAQVEAGAPADVLATADTTTMERGVSGLAIDGSPVEPVVFARNTLAVAVPGSDPAGVGSLDDLARPDVTFAVCAAEVPCGAAAGRVLSAAGITRPPVTYEPDVTAVLTKVRLGEVDAGLVYASDVRPMAPAVLDGEVRAVRIPDAVNTETSYPIAVLPGGAQDVARAFVAYVLSAEGAAVLRDAGFLEP